MRQYAVYILGRRSRRLYIGAAIAREKPLKGWLRRRKLALISSLNPTWDDLLPSS